MRPGRTFDQTLGDARKETMMQFRIVRVGAVLTLAAVSMSVHAQQTAPPREESTYAPKGTPPELGLAGWAKVLCSAVFVSGRDANEAFRNSGYFLMGEADRPFVTVKTIDRAEKAVYLTYKDSLTRSARFYGDQGCIIDRQDAKGIAFTPVPVKTTLPDANTQPWPMGDVMPADAPPAEVDQAKLQDAVDLAFDPKALTAAVVVAYKGRIVAERYAPGITKDTQLESWSMGKSVTATLFSLLVKDGEYKLEDPAPVPLWRRPGDPRGKIRIVDLLRMSSGLRFSRGSDSYPDHMYIYTGAIDVFDFSITRPLEHPPNTVGRYRNSDPLTLGYLIKQAVTRRGEEYLTWPQRALFDRIGIRRQVLETDPFGNFIMTGFDYGTARNWTRLGLLYLQDGMWQGQRMLPEGWVKFVSTPAPAWKEPVYGGQFWLNRTGALDLPRDTFYMSGGGGQTVAIVPSRDLVIVRLGHFLGSEGGVAAKAFRAAQGGIMAAIR
jgi:CubicO group peptidase (beta-lactamase class C family)